MQAFSRIERRAGVLAASGVLLVGGVVAAVPAQAAVSCGTEVTTSIALTADLTCTGDALYVTGRSGLVIDLKGHALTGSGSGNGVLVRSGSSTIEIRNGTIRGFEYGVRFDESTNNRAWNLTLTGNRRGVDVANASSNTLDRNRISGNSGDAIKVDGGSNSNRILQNVVSDNTFGLAVAAGSSNTVSQNQVTTTRSDGIWVTGAATGTSVSRNSVTSSAGNGVRVDASPTSTAVTQNTVSYNRADGIHVDASGTLIGSNLATYNAGWGIYAVPGVVDGTGNKATGNAAGDCQGVTCSAP